MSEVDSDGQVLSSFTDVRLPLHLSPVAEGHVLVADYHNSRIALLNSQLEPQRVRLDNTNSQVKLWKPSRLCCNEFTSQLYVVYRDEQPRSDVLSLFSFIIEG